MSKEKCVVCRREKSFPAEGRYISGDWVEDRIIPKKYWNRWVCSWSCYGDIPRKKPRIKLIHIPEGRGGGYYEASIPALGSLAYRGWGRTREEAIAHLEEVAKYILELKIETKGKRRAK